MLPDNIVKKYDNIYRNVYRFIDGSKEQNLNKLEHWYFKVCLCDQHTSIMYCDSQGNCVAIPDPLRNSFLKRFPEMKSWPNGYVCLLMMANDPTGELSLWKLSGKRHYQHDFIRNGTFIEKQLLELQDTIRNSVSTKQDIEAHFNELFGERLDAYSQTQSLRAPPSLEPLFEN